MDLSIKNLTVNTLGSIKNHTNNWWFLIIKGDLINNGTLTNSTSWYLELRIEGNVQNNGTMNQSNLRFSGSRTQTISGANIFSCASIWKDPNGQIIAGSNITIDSTTNVSLAGDTLNMGSYKLTKHTTWNFSNENITGGLVFSNGEIDVSGRFKSDLAGDFTLVGTKPMQVMDITCYDNFRVGTGKIIENAMNNWWRLYVKGDLINNGTIRNASAWWLEVQVEGNVQNNGTMNQSNLRFSGSRTQTISGANIFSCASIWKDPNGQIIAGSNITIDSTTNVSLAGDTLNMGSYKLTKHTTWNFSNENITGGLVFSNGEIDVSGRFKSDLAGDFTLVGTKPMQVMDITCYDNFRVGTGKIIENAMNNWWRLYVKGDLINNGTIRNASAWWLEVQAGGSITNNGLWNVSSTKLTGNRRRTIAGRDMQGLITAVGSGVMLEGQNILPRLVIESSAYCELAGNSSLYLIEGTLTGKLVNKGEVILPKKITTTGEHSYFATKVRFTSITGLDSLTVRHFGYTVPSSFTNALKSYWRLEPVPKNSPLTLDQLTLYYDDAQLGSNVESTLQVFHSTDSAQTWRQISTPISIFRDTVNNFVRVNNASITGDFVLSSSANPLSFRPSIVVSIVGRSQIRVGAPNRYTINYVNNSDTPTEDFLLAINTGARIHILKTEHPLADGKREIIPADSLFYEGEDTTLVLYVAGMAPREERTFDIIATADNLGMVSNPINNETAFIDPLSITVGTVVIWAAKAAAVYVAVKAIDYVGNKAREGLELTPEQKRQWEQRIGPIPEELKRTETKKEWAAKKIGTKIIEKTMGIVGGGVDIVRAVGRNIWNLGPNLRRRIFSAIDRDLQVIPDEQIDDKTYKPEVSGGNVKTTQRVTSWDPNEKHGPTGVGAQGFVSKAGRIHYQILFENLKTATAPAWKIVIVDTLRPEFDPATVEFGNKSHEGDQYVWNITRTGNVLRWEIEDIELPPNVNPPEGEGYVTFSVLPLTGLETGTALRNKATIVFDINPPIVTNEFVNTYDFLPPVTTMLLLPSETNKSPLIVRFNSSDGVQGSGVQSVSIYASKDGGPFNFVGTTYTDSLAVPVTNGDYEFYGLAVDLVGNVEQVRPELVKTKVTGVVGVGNEILETPKIYFLSQNYPNPFNPNTIVKYQLPVGSKVTLKIYNMLGQEVKTLVDEVQEAGYQFIEWNSTNNSGNTVASGIYFYRLEAKSVTDPSKTFTQVRKMLLLQ
ncbi:MAG: FlgD immunoglobulin-like domain containing protein [Bacteroidota bacterium]|nr:FlgD immunoglobulin-like domain containing protein [Bacteroidota bacterium]